MSGVRLVVQESGVMLPDDRPDGPDVMGTPPRWVVYLARDPPHDSVVRGRESVRSKRFRDDASPAGSS